MNPILEFLSSMSMKQTYFSLYLTGTLFVTALGWNTLRIEETRKTGLGDAILSIIFILFWPVWVPLLIIEVIKDV